MLNVEKGKKLTTPDIHPIYNYTKFECDCPI